jgi:ATP-binding cassette subfamily F protein 3
MLDNNKTILEEVYQIVPHEKVSYVRGICGAFLFSGDDVDKPVKVLSGGEKARVCLAKILIKPGNLMIMDEPTNHLDLASSEILIDALADYNGSLLFVSHNQSFVNRLATKIWDIRDGEILEYPGTLYEYYDYLARNEEGIGNRPSPERETREENESESDKSGGSKKEIRKEKAAKRTLINSRLKPVKERLLKQEERISYLEKKEKEIGTALADPGIFKDKEKSLPLLDEYGRIKKELDGLLISWEETQNEMESLSMELEI